jgi:hypothetical protein
VKKAYQPLKHMMFTLRCWSKYPKQKITVTADGLYSNQPIIDELKTAKMSFIWIAFHPLSIGFLEGAHAYDYFGRSVV